MAANMPITTIQTTERYPVTSPAVAKPVPPTVPPDALIFDCARCPQMTAGMPATGPIQSAIPAMPRIKLATASPDFGGEAIEAGIEGGFIDYRLFQCYRPDFKQSAV